jgi:hypothetical protein
MANDDPYRTAPPPCAHEVFSYLHYDETNYQCAFRVCDTCRQILQEFISPAMTSDCFDWLCAVREGMRDWPFNKRFTKVDSK